MTCIIYGNVWKNLHHIGWNFSKQHQTFVMNNFVWIWVEQRLHVSMRQTLAGYWTENNTVHNNDESCSWKPGIILLSILANQCTGFGRAQGNESPRCLLYCTVCAIPCLQNEERRSSHPHNLLLSRHLARQGSLCNWLYFNCGSNTIFCNDTQRSL